MTEKSTVSMNLHTFIDHFLLKDDDESLSNYRNLHNDQEKDKVFEMVEDIIEKEKEDSRYHLMLQYVVKNDKYDSNEAKLLMHIIDEVSKRELPPSMKGGAKSGKEAEKELALEALKEAYNKLYLAKKKLDELKLLQKPTEKENKEGDKGWLSWLTGSAPEKPIQENKPKKILDKKVPTTLTIFLNTGVPGRQHIKFSPKMVNPKTRHSKVYMDPRVRLYPDTIYNVSSPTIKKEDTRKLIKEQFFDKGWYETLKSRTLTRYRQVPLTLKEATREGIVDHNINLILSTIFRPNSILTIDGNPYTIYSYEWDKGTWKIDTTATENEPSVFSSYMPTAMPSFGGHDDFLSPMGSFSSPMGSFSSPGLNQYPNQYRSSPYNYNYGRPRIPFLLEHKQGLKEMAALKEAFGDSVLEGRAGFDEKSYRLPLSEESEKRKKRDIINNNVVSLLGASSADIKKAYEEKDNKNSEASIETEAKRRLQVARIEDKKADEEEERETKIRSKMLQISPPKDKDGPATRSLLLGNTEPETSSFSKASKTKTKLIRPQITNSNNTTTTKVTTRATTNLPIQNRQPFKAIKGGAQKVGMTLRSKVLAAPDVNLSGDKSQEVSDLEFLTYGGQNTTHNTPSGKRETVALKQYFDNFELIYEVLFREFSPEIKDRELKNFGFLNRQNPSDANTLFPKDQNISGFKEKPFKHQLNLLHVREVVSDGNCFFHAVCAGINFYNNKTNPAPVAGQFINILDTRYNPANVDANGNYTFTLVETQPARYATPQDLRNFIHSYYESLTNDFLNELLAIDIATVTQLNQEYTNYLTTPGITYEDKKNFIFHLINDNKQASNLIIQNTDMATVDAGGAPLFSISDIGVQGNRDILRTVVSNFEQEKILPRIGKHNAGYWAGERDTDILIKILKLYPITLKRSEGAEIKYTVNYDPFTYNVTEPWKNEWNKYIFLLHLTDHYKLIVFDDQSKPIGKTLPNKYIAIFNKDPIIRAPAIDDNIRDMPLQDDDVWQVDPRILEQNRKVIPPVYMLLLIYFNFYLKNGIAMVTNGENIKDYRLNLFPYEFLIFFNASYKVGEKSNRLALIDPANEYITSAVVASKRLNYLFPSEKTFDDTSVQHIPANVQKQIIDAYLQNKASQEEEEEKEDTEGAEEEKEEEEEEEEDLPGSGPPGSGGPTRLPSSTPSYYKKTTTITTTKPREKEDTDYKHIASVLEDRSNIGYYIVVDLFLYPGTSIPYLKKQAMGCNVQYQRIQKQLSAVNGTIYTMPVMTVVPRDGSFLKNKSSRKNKTKKTPRQLTIQRKNKAEKDLLAAAEKYKKLIETRKNKGKKGGSAVTKRKRRGSSRYPISGMTRKHRS